MPIRIQVQAAAAGSYRLNVDGSETAPLAVSESDTLDAVAAGLKRLLVGLDEVVITISSEPRAGAFRVYGARKITGSFPIGASIEIGEVE